MSTLPFSNVYNYIKDVFPNIPLQRIEHVIHLVQSSNTVASVEEQTETIVNMLVGYEYEDDQGDNEDGLLEEASGGASSDSKVLSDYFNMLMDVFPDACPTYVTDVCSRRYSSSFDAIFDEFISQGYRKKTIDAESLFAKLLELLPNADPSYLREHAEDLANKTDSELKSFIEEAIEKKDYPTLDDYRMNQKKQEKINQYTSNFNIDEFLKQFPNPEEHFCNPSRKCPLTQNQNTSEEDGEEAENDESYAITFLYNFYNHLRKKDIDRVFRLCDKDLVKTCTKLDTIRKSFISPRKDSLCKGTSKNVPLLQEIAFLKHRKIIKKIIKEGNENYRLLKEEAKINGLLQTCMCCSEDELIPEECYFCKNACIFCKYCVKTGAETQIGMGKLDFPCLADCGSEFSIPTLQMVLESVVFSKMAQRKQMDEIKRANLDGLETCPFCDFATIPPPNTKIFECLNKDCLKESCRECRHLSHIPLRCNEIEYSEDVKMRTYIENRMTEALVRTCWKCHKSFIKDSGCNKMTCQCGARMCYVCNAAVHDYEHFGQGNDKRCPLYTQDLNKFHNDAVLNGARVAKVELGLDKDPSKLKFDPTKNFGN